MRVPCLSALLAAWLVVAASCTGTREGFVQLAASGDGTTDATAAIAEAVDQAYRSGEWLYFPGGTYLTTSSIPNFHAVRKFGPGVVKRGDNLFHIDPGPDQQNQLFVDDDGRGDDANDGLGPGRPLQTIQAAADIVEAAQSSDRSWRINLAPGTRYAAVAVAAATMGHDAIDIVGPTLSQEDGQSIILRFAEGSRSGRFAVGDTITQSGSGATCTSTEVYEGAIVCTWASGTFVASGALTDGTSGATAETNAISLVPRAAIDGTGDESDHGVRVDRGARVRIYDVKVQDFSSGNCVTVHGASSELSLINLHLRNCLKGATATYSARISAYGGDWDCRDARGAPLSKSAGYQALFNATHDMHQASAEEALVIHHCARNMLIDEGAQGHLDRVKLFDATGSGFNIKRGAGAVNAKQMYIWRNAVGVLAENNQWFDNGVNFTSGASGGDGNDNNRINVKSLGNSPELIFLTAHNDARTMRVISTSAAAPHTGTTDRADLWTSVTIPDWVISEPGSHHFARVTVNFEASLSGPAAIDAVIDNGAPDRMGAIKIPAGTTDGRIVLEVRHESASHENAMLSGIGQPSFATADFEAADSAGGTLKNTEFVLRLRAALSDASDSITFHNVVFEATYGG
jgi:hypothetical protein